MNCAVCGVEVEEIARRPTVPSDFEYRFQAVKVFYVDPETREDHRCRLKPRVQMAYTPPTEIRQEISEDPPPQLDVSESDAAALRRRFAKDR